MCAHPFLHGHPSREKRNGRRRERAFGFDVSIIIYYRPFLPVISLLNLATTVIAYDICYDLDVEICIFKTMIGWL